MWDYSSALYAVAQVSHCKWRDYIVIVRLNHVISVMFSAGGCCFFNVIKVLRLRNSDVTDKVAMTWWSERVYVLLWAWPVAIWQVFGGMWLVEVVRRRPCDPTTNEQGSQNKMIDSRGKTNPTAARKWLFWSLEDLSSAWELACPFFLRTHTWSSTVTFEAIRIIRVIFFFS